MYMYIHLVPGVGTNLSGDCGEGDVRFRMRKKKLSKNSPFFFVSVHRLIFGTIYVFGTIYILGTIYVFGTICVFWYQVIFASGCKKKSSSSLTLSLDLHDLL